MAGASYLRPFAFEVVEVTDASVGTLTEAVFTEKVNRDTAQPAREATITIEDNSIRFRIDGGDPTQTEGHYVGTSGSVTITTSTAIKQFKAVAIGTGVTATLMVTYFQG